MARRKSRRRYVSRRKRGAVAIRYNEPRRRRRRYRMNEPRRQYRRNEPRRRYRRNPDGITQAFLWDALYVGGGFVATKVVGNMVFPMIPMTQQFPSVRILGKAATAWLVGWGGSMILGRRAGSLLMVGGFVDAVDDAIRTYLGPFLPALAAYPELSSYPQLSANGYDYTNPYGMQVGAGEYSSEDAV